MEDLLHLQKSKAKSKGIYWLTDKIKFYILYIQIAKDWHLFLIILIIVLIDAVIIIPFISVSVVFETPQLIKNNEIQDRTNVSAL